MEQTNLVVTADGKTWDEFSRDTSYIGNGSLQARCQDVQNTINFDDLHHGYGLERWRGKYQNTDCYNKDWAIAWDRNICLREGDYQIAYNTLRSSQGDGGEVTSIRVNGAIVTQWYSEDADYRTAGQHVFNHHFYRGDYIQVYGIIWSSYHSMFTITRLS